MQPLPSSQDTVTLESRLRIRDAQYLLLTSAYGKERNTLTVKLTTGEQTNSPILHKFW